MADEELDPTQGELEGETVVNPSDENPAPEQETETPETGEAEQPEVVEQQPEPENPKPTEKKKLPWEIKRINEETNKRREAERRAAELEAEIARLKGSSASETEEQPGKVDVEAIRNQERERIRREEQQKLEAERFNEACNRTFEAGVSAYGNDFEHARDTLVNALGDQIQKRPEFLEAITDLDNGHQVFYELGRHPEDAERILRLPHTKMVIELAKLSAGAAKPAPKPISKAPAPVAPVGGAPKTSGRLDDEDTPMDEWATKFLSSLAPR
jgi:flagellar biosynthesis GTPase FlhF